MDQGSWALSPPASATPRCAPGRASKAGWVAAGRGGPKSKGTPRGNLAGGAPALAKFPLLSFLETQGIWGGGREGRKDPGRNRLEGKWRCILRLPAARTGVTDVGNSLHGRQEGLSLQSSGAWPSN